MKQSTFFDQTTTQTLKLLDSTNGGLSTTQATTRLSHYGANSLPSGKRVGFWGKFAAQFADLMIAILLVSAGISFAFALAGDNRADLLESFVIVAIVLLNAILGALQEQKAEKQLDRLKSMTIPTATVSRDGKLCSVASNAVTVGDVVHLQAGDVVCADARLLQSTGLRVNEASLTGESIAVEKSADILCPKGTPLAERKNCVHYGTAVVAGSATAVVYAIGNQTEMGKIAGMLAQTSKSKTPLQQRLQALSNTLGVACIGICLLVLAISFFKGLKHAESVKHLFLDTFINAVSLAVAVVPEGLPAVVTVTLAGGVTRLVARSVIVKTLPAVETLGSANVICCDKTGTLTCNQMTLQCAYDGSMHKEDFSKCKQLLELFSYCSNVQMQEGKFVGDETETAVVSVAQRVGASVSAPKVYQIPFDSNRKMMTTVVRTNDGYLCVSKGAYDVLTSKCDNGGQFFAMAQSLSLQGLRVLAVAYKRVAFDFVKSNAIESSLTMAGLVALSDPLRPNAKESIFISKQAGIKTVMITGDSPTTATKIATELGIYKQGDVCVTGNQIDEGINLDKVIDKVSVFARTTPQHKLQIVKAFQRKGYVVAMTGDGVNDAPALKRADVGCAMGSGTEVAKNTADLILVKDDVSTLVEAVRQGRSVFSNIKRAVQYLLSCNVGEVLAVVGALLVCNRAPLCAMQLLWINLVTDGLPGIALGMERASKSVMNQPPNPKGRLIDAKQWVGIVAMGVCFAISTLIGYAVGNKISANAASTMAFLVLATSQLFYSLLVASNYKPFTNGVAPFTAISFVVSLFLVVVVCFVSPLANLFQLAALPTRCYLIALALSVAPSVVSLVAVLLASKVSFYKN